MRHLVIASLSLAGCHGSVEITAMPAPCVTSFACPAGERCEASVCVADTDCPPPLAPTIVYQTTGVAADGASVLLNGREYWKSPVTITLGSAVTATRFVDLATKATSTFPHPLGWASCDGDPVACVDEPADGGPATLHTGVHLDASTQTWLADASFHLPAGYSAFARDQPAVGRWLLWSFAQKTLAAWDPPSGALDPLVVLAKPDILGGVIQAMGIPTSIAALQNGSPSATISVAPVEKGATPTTIFTLAGSVKTVGFPIPTGNGAWFIFHDTPGDASGYRVGHADGSGQTEIGTLDDPLAFPVAASYQSGSPALEGGSRGRGVACSGQACRTGVVDFAAVSVQPVGSATVAGATNLSAADARWLSCDTAEVLVEDRPPAAGGPPAALTLYRLRVEANAGK